MKKILSNSIKILYILSQKPGNTGSGVYLTHITKEALKHNIDFRVIVGISEESDLLNLSHIDRERIYPLFFLKDIPFIIPGMSDVMPYHSVKFSNFNDDMFHQYCEGFKKIFQLATKNWTPDIIHSNHLWIVSALAKNYFKKIPLVVSCHGTAIRQKELAPHIDRKIRANLSEIDKILALTEKQKKNIIDWLKINENKVEVTGSGYADYIFCDFDKSKFSDENFKIIYAGKISFSKGVPYLINAFQKINDKLKKKILLYIAGDYNSSEGEIIRNSIVKKHCRNIIFLGKLNQKDLANKFRECHLFILPSFFEGLPLVIPEALACGCVAIVSELPDISLWIDRALVDNEVVKFIPLPKLKTIDEPCEKDVRKFVEHIKNAITYYALKFFNREFPDIEKYSQYIKTHSFENLFKRIYEIYLKIL